MLLQVMPPRICCAQARGRVLVCVDLNIVPDPLIMDPACLLDGRFFQTITPLYQKFIGTEYPHEQALFSGGLIFQASS
ncbi:hypothetical protein [Photobacterium salinisoli]|uniref:hypothetical protein n=1 Tax=Photobacterium salinisoli TaxID=1616783 RepID=UPI001F08D96F|nr:hypothetical protein [Photobacterium salinisoli]